MEVVLRVANDSRHYEMMKSVGGKISFRTNNYDEAFVLSTVLLGTDESDGFEKGDLMLYKDGKLIEIVDDSGM